MTRDPSTAEHKSTFCGWTYSLCSEGSRSKFLAKPEIHVNAVEAKPTEVPAGTIWACPMHPEIRRDAPGLCPMGGMVHEPDMTAADSAPSEELVDVTQRFWIGFARAVPDFVLEMAAHVADGLSTKASTLL